jgi:hypothetical protein
MKTNHTLTMEKRQASINRSQSKIKRKKDTEERLSNNPSLSLTPNRDASNMCLCGHTEEQHASNGRCNLCSCSKFEPTLREHINDIDILLGGFR